MSGIVLTAEFLESNDRLSLTVEDTTGAYSGSNTGGWGAPNDAAADAETATVEVTLPNATSVAATIDVYPTLPNTSSALFTINNTDVGLGATIELPDGVYKFVYTVERASATPFSYSITCYVLFFKKSCKYLDKMVATLTVDGCECGGEGDQGWTETDIYELRTKYQGAIDNACCGKHNKAQDVIDYLDGVFGCFFDDYVNN